MKKIKLLSLGIISKNSKQVCKWNNCYFSNENDERDYDYYMINNYLSKNNNNYYCKDKCIVSHHEPWIYDERVNYGVHTWDYWKDASDILHLHNHKNYLNICLFIADEKEINELHQNNNIKNKEYKICTIQSDKYNDEGQKVRLDFIKYLEQKDIHIDVYGTNREYQNYHGSIPYNKNGLEDRKNCMSGYKYYLHGENNYEHNYITEKLMEPIINECLVFYFGGPNVYDYFDSRSFVMLDKNDLEKSYQIVKKAIEENWYEQRYEFICKEKKRVLDIYSLAPTVENITNYYDLYIFGNDLIQSKNNRIDFNKKRICLINLKQDNIVYKLENILLNLRSSTIYDKLDYILIQSKQVYEEYKKNKIGEKYIYIDMNKFSTNGKYEYHLLYNLCMFEKNCEILYINDNNICNYFLNELGKQYPLTFDIIISKKNRNLFYTSSNYFYKCNITLDKDDILTSGYNVNECYL